MATTKKYAVELAPKSIRYVMRALEFQMRDFQTKLDTGKLSEDEEADLNNDLRLLEIIHGTFAEALPPPPSD